MFTLIKNLIGYTGTSNIDSTIYNCCVVLIIIGTVVTIDLLYKFFLRLLPRDSK